MPIQFRWFHSDIPVADGASCFVVTVGGRVRCSTLQFSEDAGKTWINVLSVDEHPSKDDGPRDIAPA